MYEFIDSSDNVIALKLTNTITGDDLNAIMDRVDNMMAKQETTHVFVETHAIDGLQLSALPNHVSRVLPLFGKLARFARVAVVADQAWMRIGTRLESALLPSVSYRVFQHCPRPQAESRGKTGLGCIPAHSLVPLSLPEPHGDSPGCGTMIHPTWKQ